MSTTMTSPDRDDAELQRWADLLAGRAQPQTAEERHTAALREVLLAELAERKRHEQARNTRIRNAVQARLDAAAAASAAPAAATGPLQAVWHWLFPPGAARLPRTLALAAGLGAALVVPMGLERMALHGEDDAAGMKSIRGIGQPGDASGVQTLTVSDPQAASEQVLAVLAAQGVPAQSQSAGGITVLQAQVPPDRIKDVADALAPSGVRLGPQGQLQLRLVAQP